MNSRIDEMESRNGRRRKIRPEDALPPRLTICQLCLLWLARAAIVGGSLYIADICFQILRDPTAVTACSFCSYVALAVFLSGLVGYFVICHKVRVHKARKEDRSEIEALIQEAKYVQPRLTDPERPIDFKKKRKKIKKEVRRLKKKVGPEGWTEFQVLMLDRLLIDFLSLEDLKARARSSLEELKEYAEGDAFSYDVKLYYDWEERITSIIDALNKDDGAKEEEKDDKVEALRANLRSLRDHVAEYQFNWAEGSTIVSSIRICGSATVVVFTIMGILPTLFPVENFTLQSNLRLGVLNWGYLGVSGAISSALIGLRKAKEVEVGYTSGRQELWRMVIGAPLGLVSGILVFSALQGGLIEGGAAVPNFNDPSGVYLSIVWAVFAGMGLERVFQRLRGAVEF